MDHGKEFTHQVLGSQIPGTVMDLIPLKTG